MASEAPHSLVGAEQIAAMCKLAGEMPPGAIVEVGVWHGGTAWHLAKVAEAQQRHCYLFDTFTGIPYREDFDPHRVGDFSDTDIDTIRAAIPYAFVVPGVFPASAEGLIAAQFGWHRVAFVHLDCDQYQSYRDALAYLTPLMVDGGVVWCDDDTCLPGAERAVAEFVASHVGRVEKRAHAGKTTLHFTTGDTP